MTIVTFISNNVPSPAAGFATKAVAIGAAKRGIEVRAEEAEDICRCCYENLVLAGGAEDYQNDESSVIWRMLTPNDTVTFTLQKASVDQVVLNDNTYGTFYALGALPNDLYSGFKIDWASVLAAFGEGVYRVKADLTLVGVVSEEFSIEFVLKTYNDVQADSTVRFDWFQNGNIRSNEFDFTGFNWYQSYRLRGFFGLAQPELTQDNIFKSDFKIEQIQDTVTPIYTFKSEVLPLFFTKKITKDLVLANEIFVTDFNRFNHDKEIVKRPVIVDGFEENEYFTASDVAGMTVKFKDRTQNIIKRNF